MYTSTSSGHRKKHKKQTERKKTEQELEKEKIDTENAMRSFIFMADNEYRCKRKIDKHLKLVCNCFGTTACGNDCENRLVSIECSSKCVLTENCSNRRFQNHENAPCIVFKTEKKGYGLKARSCIPANTFLIEYVGEILNQKQLKKRGNDYSKQMNDHYYFMALGNNLFIDATQKGNISRFINHSCDPNSETQKWTVNGESRIGIFSKRPIKSNEEITFDYQFERFG